MMIDFNAARNTVRDGFTRPTDERGDDEMPQDDTETREQYLERLLAEMVDAVVGASYHDLYGYGYGKDEIREIEEICHAYWDKRYGRKSE